MMSQSWDWALHQALHGDCLIFSPSLSLALPPLAHALSLSLSKKKKKKKRGPLRPIACGGEGGIWWGAGCIGLPGHFHLWRKQEVFIYGLHVVWGRSGARPHRCVWFNSILTKFNFYYKAMHGFVLKRQIICKYMKLKSESPILASLSNPAFQNPTPRILTRGNRFSYCF